MEQTSKPSYSAIAQKNFRTTPWSSEHGEDTKEGSVPFPVDVVNVTYPDPMEYQFTFVGSPRKVDKYLEVLSIGCVNNNRVWPWSIATPPCLVQFREMSNKYSNKGSTYVVLSPDYFNHENGFHQFTAFMNHLKAVSQYLKGKCSEVGRDVSKWDDPEMQEDSMITGIRARIKIPNVLEFLKAHQTIVKCILKLSCIYFSRDKASMSLEIIECVSSP